MMGRRFERMVQEMEMMVFIHNLMLGLGGALDLSGMGA